MDIASLAKTVSGWVRRVDGSDRVVTDMGEAIFAARQGQVVTLICPADYMGASVTVRELPDMPVPAATVDQGLIEEAARRLRELPV